MKFFFFSKLINKSKLRDDEATKHNIINSNAARKGKLDLIMVLIPCRFLKS